MKSQGAEIKVIRDKFNAEIKMLRDRRDAEIARLISEKPRVEIVNENKCGNQDTHWYSSGDTCICGQVPVDIFFASSCTCGGYRLRKPIHKLNCGYVDWVAKHNRWIQEHPEVNPPLKPASVKTNPSVELMRKPAKEGGIR